jgi:hypothetical protein
MEDVELGVGQAEARLVEMTEDSALQLIADIRQPSVVVEPEAQLPDDPARAELGDLHVRCRQMWLDFAHLRRSREQQPLNPLGCRVMVEGDGKRLAELRLRPAVVTERLDREVGIGEDDAHAVAGDGTGGEPAHLDDARGGARLDLNPVADLVGGARH